MSNAQLASITAPIANAALTPIHAHASVSGTTRNQGDANASVIAATEVWNTATSRGPATSACWRCRMRFQA